MRRDLYTVEGPAKIRVLSGSLYAVGRVLRQNDELIVPREIVLCIDALEDTVIEAISASAPQRADRGTEVLDTWRELSERVVGEGKTVIVVGETDSGKTTFSTFLINTALSRGARVAFIDADVGQNDVGLPGTLSLSFPARHVSWPSELEPAYMCFVGSNTPYGKVDVILIGLLELLEKCGDADTIIVNTDGWLSDSRALSYKAYMIKAVKPDVVVVMRGLGGAQPLIRMLENSRVKVVEAPSPTSFKERDLRRLRRRMSYLRLLREGDVKKLSLDDVRFFGTRVFNGVALNEEVTRKIGELVNGAVYAEVVGEELYVATGENGVFSRIIEKRDEISSLVRKRVTAVNTADLKGLLVGLLDENLDCVGVALLEELNPEKRVIKLRTNADLKNVRFLVPGILKLLEDGSEVRCSYPPLS